MSLVSSIFSTPSGPKRRSRSVFVSYSTEDERIAATIAERLREHGFQVWRAADSLRAGDRWPVELGKAIAESAAVVLLWSPFAAKSHFVEFEWATALALRVPLLPIL